MLKDNLDYGVIGNGRSAALVSHKGTLEWCCLPDFDSPSFFANILDEEVGGEFAIEVDDTYTIAQQYLPRTNILITTFKSQQHAFEILDCMPRYRNNHNRIHYPPDIIRYFRVLTGRPHFRLRYQPRPCFGQFKTRTEVRGDYIKTSTENGSYESIYLYSSFNLTSIASGSEIVLTDDSYCMISYNQKIGSMDADNIHLELEKTRVYWLDWSARSPKFPCYNKEINRSALVLKLLSYQKTGAILAAVTTSLPETIGHERNWDYRFCWLRDASMVISVLTRLNHYNVARRYIDYLISIVPFKDEKIQIMYGINRQKKLTERVLPWLSGYCDSRPVRIGNAAYHQKQNDIFGVTLDVIYKYFTLFHREMHESREALWTVVRSMARHVENNWRKPDMSIWEFRTQKKHFTFSKVLSWVAMDRAIKTAALLRMDWYVHAWSETRQKIRQDIMTNGWNSEIEAFTQFYGSQYLDAANLLMEHYGFIDAHSPQYISTVLKIQERLCHNGLMFRYRNEDDFGAPSTSFTVCTFWLIKSLYKIGRHDEAIEMFDNLLKCSNHLGLFSEDLDFETKRLLGNFPQGYSHLALIDTALALMGEE